jgi:hypothetical protein
MSAAGDVVDRLYGLPLEEFTPQRDLAARELRRAGDREAAAELAKLPKPTPAAWTANQVARERPELIEGLLDAGAALRSAQEEALAGGGGGALRDAMAGQRRAIEALMDAAQSYRPAGRALSRAMADRLRMTLQAAAGDEALSAALAAGRLVDEAQAGGAWPLGPAPEGGEVVGRRTKRAARGGGARRGAAAGDEDAAAHDAAAAEAAERERAALEAELRKVRGALRVRERTVAGAEEAAEQARTAAAEAAERLQRARQAAEDAQAEAEAAEQALSEARDALQAARDDVARLEERLD